MGNGGGESLDFRVHETEGRRGHAIRKDLLFSFRGGGAGARTKGLGVGVEGRGVVMVVIGRGEVVMPS